MADTDHRTRPGLGTPRRPRRMRLAGLLGTAALVLALPATAGATGPAPFLTGLTHQRTVASTVPANGDLNPYGVAVVPATTGRLVAGDVLVSNFNDAGNAQGTGTTIVEVAPDGTRSLFATVDASTLPGPCPGGVGLTTALTVFADGVVVVGSLPTTAGTLEPGGAGCLIVLNDRGVALTTVEGNLIDGPWDLASVDRGSVGILFVTNVLNGTLAASPGTVARGTVVRIVLTLNRAVPTVTRETVVGSGFSERTDPAALVVGPTGLALGSGGSLYVADSDLNRITVIPDALGRSRSAGTGTVLTRGGLLNDPLGLTVAPDGDLLSVNGNNGDVVETTPSGQQVADTVLDDNPQPGPEPGNGALFGLAVAPGGHGLYFVDDDQNTLDLRS